MDRLGELAVLLESGSRSSVPFELEIEVAKMIYRNFEVHPPTKADKHPELAKQLFDIATLYAHPRLLLQNKRSAAASLAIVAIVAMRSTCSSEAIGLAIGNQHQWFGELVMDDLHNLHRIWQPKSPGAAAWLQGLLDGAIANIE